MLDVSTDIFFVSDAAKVSSALPSCFNASLALATAFAAYAASAKRSSWLFSRGDAGFSLTLTRFFCFSLSSACFPPALFDFLLLAALQLGKVTEDVNVFTCVGHILVYLNVLHF